MNDDLLKLARKTLTYEQFKINNNKRFQIQKK